MNRRQFLSTGAAACTVGFAASNVMATPRQQKLNAEKYSKMWFQQALNGQFHLDDNSWQGVRMELVAVNDGPQSSKLEQFSVVFQTNSSKQVSSGLYHVKHASDGWFQVYLERGLMSENGLQYHAAFNRLT